MGSSQARLGPSMSLTKISCLLLPLLAVSVSAASNLIFKKIEIQVGAVGSDDDIRIKICSGSTCCSTDKLSNLLGREWVAKKKETWDGGKLGNCSRVQFSDKLSSIDVTLLKNGKKEGPQVVNMNITGQIGKDKKAVTVFKCGSYSLSKTEKQKSGVCLDRNIQTTTKSLPAPSVAQKKSVNVNLNMISVQIGDDGTDNDVSLQICSEKSSTDCCETGKLDKTLRDDWKKKKLEKWEKKHLGACKTKTFDACKGFDVAIKKKASKDTLKVSSITMEVTETDKSSSKKSFVCSDYMVGAKDSLVRKTCRLDSRSSLSCSASKKSGSSSLSPLSTYTALMLTTVIALAF